MKSCVTLRSFLSFIVPLAVPSNTASLLVRQLRYHSFYLHPRLDYTRWLTIQIVVPGRKSSFEIYILTICPPRQRHTPSTVVTSLIFLLASVNSFITSIVSTTAAVDGAPSQHPPKNGDAPGHCHINRYPLSRLSIIGCGSSPVLGIQIKGTSTLTFPVPIWWGIICSLSLLVNIATSPLESKVI